MFGLHFVKGAAVSLATLGMMIPQGQLLADASPAKPIVKTAQVNNRIPEIVLTAGGTLTGRVCDHNGKAIEGAKVTLKESNKVVGTTMTNKDGVYAFKNLKNGVYYPSSGNTEGVFRVWTEKSAPPSAKHQHALLVMGENGARGQFGGIDPTLVVLTAGVIAAVVLSAVAINKIDNLSDKVDSLSVSP